MERRRCSPTPTHRRRTWLQESRAGAFPRSLWANLKVRWIPLQQRGRGSSGRCRRGQTIDHTAVPTSGLRLHTIAQDSSNEECRREWRGESSQVRVRLLWQELTANVRRSLLRRLKSARDLPSSLRSLCVAFLSPLRGLFILQLASHGLRRGLYSVAVSRLGGYCGAHFLQRHQGTTKTPTGLVPLSPFNLATFSSARENLGTKNWLRKDLGIRSADVVRFQLLGRDGLAGLQFLPSQPRDQLGARCCNREN